MNRSALDKTVRLVSEYFDSRKVGCVGAKGFRKTTDLSKLAACMEELASTGLISPERTTFVDLGCGDGRVNLLMSYFVRLSIGIEIDGEILSEYARRRGELIPILDREGGLRPPENIFLFRASSLDEKTFEQVRSETGASLEGVDLFYTYITLHDLFAEKIALQAKPGAYYLVYGFSRVLPRYDALDLVSPDVGAQGIAALFRKPV
ncbi:MAG: hypothetical protein LLG06_04390 [Desulfobacteraceae bacterium]|nr:hypothetical protein [Desulfobacteraceae bacterium]